MNPEGRQRYLIHTGHAPPALATPQGWRLGGLADGAGVLPAGLELSLQQLYDDGLAEVGGGAPLPHGLAVVERLHAVLNANRDSTTVHQPSGPTSGVRERYRASDICLVVVVVFVVAKLLKFSLMLC